MIKWLFLLQLNRTGSILWVYATVSLLTNRLDHIRGYYYVNENSGNLMNSATIHDPNCIRVRAFSNNNYYY